MDTKEISFLKIIKEYFSQKKPEELLVDEYNNIIIDPYWFYGETEDTKINGEKFEEYLAKALVKLRPTNIDKNGKKYKGYFDGTVQKELFKAKCDKIQKLKEQLNVEYIDSHDANLTQEEEKSILDQFIKKINSKVKKIRLKMYDKDGNILDNVKLIVTGLDGYTSQQICEHSEGKYFQSTEEELYKAIVKGLSSEEILNPDLEAFALSSIRKNMINMANNFVKYYEYLLQEIKENEKRGVITISLHQNTSSDSKKNNKLNDEKKERKHEIIDYAEREKLMKDVGFEQVANILSSDLEKKQQKYDCIMFSKEINDESKDKNGKIVWLEPIYGEHFSRVAFCDKERIDKIKLQTKEKDEIRALAKYFYSKSHEEFMQESNITIIVHTTIEAFDRIVDVLVSDSKKIKEGVYKKDNNEFNRKKKKEKLYGIVEVKKMTEEVPKEEYDKAEQQIINMMENEKVTNEKNK